MLGLLALASVVRPGTAQTCDACGASSTYEETISRQQGLWKRSVSASGCPNHYSFCTGKDLRGCGGNFVFTRRFFSRDRYTIWKPSQAEGTETKADVLNLEFEMPAEPVIATSTDDLTLSLIHI